MLAFTLGSATVHQLRELPSNDSSIALLLAAFLLLLIARKWSQQLVAIIAMTVLGVGVTALTAQHRLDQRLALAHSGKTLSLDAEVISVVTRRNNVVRFVARDIKTGQRLRLSWYQSRTAADLVIRPHEKWRFTAKIFAPRGFSNPGTMDYERWLLQQDIHATGYIKGVPERLTAAPAVSVHGLRQQLMTTIRHELAAQPVAAAIVSALVVGDRSGLDSEQWQTFAATGTSHLIAISGLHIGLVAGFAWLLGRWFGRRLIPHRPTLVVPVLAAICMVLGAVAYALLAGFTIPTQRALVMVIMFSITTVIHRYFPWLVLVACAAFAVQLFDPLATLSIGFWLSFAAVICIGYSSLSRQHQRSMWRSIIYVQLVISCLMAPLTLLFFNQWSAVSPVANIILIPIYSFVVVPLALLGAVFDCCGLGSLGLWSLAAWVVDLSYQGMLWLASWQWAAFATAQWAILPVFLLLLCLIIAVLPLPHLWRAVVFVSGVIYLVFTPRFSDSVSDFHAGEYVVTTLDVGQGLAVVVRTANHTLLFDAGPKFRSGTNVGALVAVPYLRSVGVSELDSFVLSHDDNDHTGGAAFVAERMAIKKRYASFPAGGSACQSQSWTWEGVTFQFLDAHRSRAQSDNNKSCVLLIKSPYGNTVLPGDIEAVAEQALLDGLTPVDVLLMPHHGSRSSSTAAFVQQLQPVYAIASTGYKNRYGFPHADVVARYQMAGAAVINTAASGAVSIKVLQQGVQKPFRWRKDASRYWNQP